MLKIELIGGACCPRVYCDQCELVIDEASQGICEWVMVKEGNIMESSVAHFLHKKCGPDWEKRMLRTRGHELGWQPLQSFLVYMAGNLKVAWGDTRAAEAAEMFR